LKRIGSREIPESGRRGLDAQAEAVALSAIEAVRDRGESGLREWAEKMGELVPGDPLVIGRKELGEAFESLDEETKALLGRARSRIADFAAAQRASLGDFEIAVPGGQAGQEFLPVSKAGCYVPGGRYPLPSSALMTVCAAKAAGVATVWCAGPHPSPVTLAAAWIAGADGFLAAGGAQAIAALAYGVGSPSCDVIVGPGGRYVAAAKRLLFGVVGTEAPAGPSELLVIADGTADPDLAAADLLAQAEHDIAAIPALVASDEDFALSVETALVARLALLPEPNRATASAALGNGWICVIDGCAGDHGSVPGKAGNFPPEIEGGTGAPERSFLEAACELADRFAPEHLELLVRDPVAYRNRLRNAGAIFMGPASAEVMGDYGAGPNHCLPTGGAARFAAGLSVLAFLRARTWLELENPEELAIDAAAFARIEGLEAHARAADARRDIQGVRTMRAGAPRTEPAS
jgi:phosphoribosyl-ATP pyrophosphohydrolase/phosphoribosyl-AMP cyclohydrolase/histidinol dehydrogenase